MNEEHQACMLKRLGEVWAKYPEWRLGQLLENIRRSVDPHGDLFYIEDYDLFTGFGKFSPEIKQVSRTEFLCVDLTNKEE
jgi:hypothetical protein